MATRATAVDQDEAELLIRQAGEGMLLFVQRALWETLTLQAKAEGRSPGEILNDALRMYLEAKGSDDAVEYLHILAGGRR